MHNSTLNQLRTRWLDVYLIFVGLVSIVYGFHTAGQQHGWVIGEWLINYSDGFVRRGLLGEIILIASHIIKIRMAWLVFAVQVAAYVTFLWTVHRIARTSRWNIGLTFQVLSPATLSFIVLDPPTVFKKDNLLFAALGLLLCVFLFGRERLKVWQLSALLTILLPALVLSHEPLLLYMPYLLAPVLLFSSTWQRTLGIALFPAILTLCAAAAVATHPGTPEMARAICSSVGGAMPIKGEAVESNICSGGIQWLSRSAHEAQQITAEAVQHDHYIPLYGLLVFPALVPGIWQLVWLYRRRGMHRQVVIVAICGALALAASTLLFVDALDWGRWIHMHAVCLMLLTLTLTSSFEPTPCPMKAPLALPGQGPLAGVRRPQKPLAVIVLAAWTLCWTLPAVPIYPSRTGYIGLVRYFLAYGSLHR